MFDTVEIQEVKESIGLLIRTVRKQRKLSQIELSELLNVSRNTIQNLESGKNFTADTVLKVLKEFDLLQNLHQEVLKVKQDIEQTKSLY